MECNVSVTDSRLEIHLYWAGKGSTLTPTKYYGPLISAISVYPGYVECLSGPSFLIFNVSILYPFLLFLPLFSFSSLVMLHPQTQRRRGEVVQMGRKGRGIVGRSRPRCLWWRKSWRDVKENGCRRARSRHMSPIIQSITLRSVTRTQTVVFYLDLRWFFGILILALSWALVRIRHRKLKGLELHPGVVFDFKKLKAATNGFAPDNKIDGVGNVYKACFMFTLNSLAHLNSGELDGIQIAVKQLSAKSEEGAHEFVTAIGTISALKHPNLATLMGSCTEQNQLLLVYKYMEKVSLQHALFGPAEAKLELNWETRAKICLGVAKGLACLHESKLQVIHCNIKPTNILLDNDFTVKISDFGYSQFHDSQLVGAPLDKGKTALGSHDSQHVDAPLVKDKTPLGSLPKPKITGHMSGEQIQGFPLTPKADVYSFGIITLEIVSGQEIITLRSKGSNDYLLNKASILENEGNLIALVDPDLKSNYNRNEALTMLCLAMKCVNQSFGLRPTMPYVVNVLEGNEKFD
ncbi:unnamed protein product, partial [Coffea canephora]